MIFQNREEAGIKLAQKLGKYRQKNTLVLALPRGGVPVALQIAKSLNSPLDVYIVRKIALPSNPELAIGAVAQGGILYIDQLAIHDLKIPKKLISEITQKELLEITRRRKVYRGNRPPVAVKGKTIILVDDGIATGATIKAAIRAIRKQHPAGIIIAVPVSPEDIAMDLSLQVNEFISLETIKFFTAVGAYYKNFAQITDNDVKSYLQSYQ